MNIINSNDKGFLKGAHKYKTLTFISLLPFYLTALFIVISIGMDSIVWSVIIPSCFSLFISGFGFSSGNKKWNIAAWISVTIFTLCYVVVGYYDYFQWFSTKVAIVLLIFFVAIFAIKRFLDNNYI